MAQAVRQGNLQCHSVLWSRQPDAWDEAWEQEELQRRQHAQQLVLAQLGKLLGKSLSSA
eukprot:gene5721-5960_t